MFSIVFKMCPEQLLWLVVISHVVLIMADFREAFKAHVLVENCQGALKFGIGADRRVGGSVYLETPIEVVSLTHVELVQYLEAWSPAARGGLFWLPTDPTAEARDLLVRT